MHFDKTFTLKQIVNKKRNSYGVLEPVWQETIEGKCSLDKATEADAYYALKQGIVFDYKLYTQAFDVSTHDRVIVDAIEFGIVEKRKIYNENQEQVAQVLLLQRYE